MRNQPQNNKGGAGGIAAELYGEAVGILRREIDQRRPLFKVDARYRARHYAVAAQRAADAYKSAKDAGLAIEVCDAWQTVFEVCQEMATIEAAEDLFLLPSE